MAMDDYLYKPSEDMMEAVLVGDPPGRSTRCGRICTLARPAFVFIALVLIIILGIVMIAKIDNLEMEESNWWSKNVQKLAGENRMLLYVKQQMDPKTSAAEYQHIQTLLNQTQARLTGMLALHPGTAGITGNTGGGSVDISGLQTDIRNLQTKIDTISSQITSFSSQSPGFLPVSKNIDKLLKQQREMVSVLNNLTAKWNLTETAIEHIESGLSPNTICIYPFKAVTQAPPKQGDARLVNGPNCHTGRVEYFYNNIWGTVCDDGFGDDEGGNTSLGYNNAHVICKQLGYDRAQRFYVNTEFGPGRTQTWVDDLKCTGSEKRIEDCGMRTPMGKNDCSNTEDVGVRCFDPNEPIHGANRTTTVAPAGAGGGGGTGGGGGGFAGGSRSRNSANGFTDGR